MQTQNLIDADKVMDVRSIPCSVKHPLIIKTWRELAVGDHFILCNDHDPVRMHEQFAAQWPDTFIWQYLVKEADAVRVKITKLKELGEPSPAIATTCDGH